MLAAYADEHVNRRITAGLRRKGVDVVTAQERGQRATDDEILLATATAEGRLMLTNDRDFLVLHSEWMASGRTHSGIVFWTKKLRIGTVVQRIFDYASQTTALNAANTFKFL